MKIEKIKKNNWLLTLDNNQTFITSTKKECMTLLEKYTLQKETINDRYNARFLKRRKTNGAKTVF